MPHYHCEASRKLGPVRWASRVVGSTSVRYVWTTFPAVSARGDEVMRGYELQMRSGNCPNDISPVIYISQSGIKVTRPQPGVIEIHLTSGRRRTLASAAQQMRLVLQCATDAIAVQVNPISRRLKYGARHTYVTQWPFDRVWFQSNLCQPKQSVLGQISWKQLFHLHAL